MSLTLNINGTDRVVDSDPDTPLIFVLRDELGLKGAKRGCGREQCGCCAQCGDCTAGLVVAVTGLLEANPTPSRDEAAEALTPHLCRCGSHPRVFRAVEIAAAATDR